MNSIVIAGALGRDAQTRTTQGGESVTGFSVAVNNGKDQDATWFDCSMWGDRGTKLAQYLTKGKRVTVSGRVSARSHEGKAYLQVNVSNVTLMSPADSGERSDGYATQAASGPAHRGLDDEIPF